MYAKTPKMFTEEERASVNYFEVAVNWLPNFSFMPPIIAGLQSDSSWSRFSHYDVTKTLSGLDSSCKQSLGLTQEQIESTYKAKGCTVTYPNDDQAFGINGNSILFNWFGY